MNYYEKEGIQLEYDQIKKNPGLRTLAKLMLELHVGEVWSTPQQNPSQRIW